MVKRPADSDEENNDPSVDVSTGSARSKVRAVMQWRVTASLDWHKLTCMARSGDCAALGDGLLLQRTRLNGASNLTTITSNGARDSDGDDADELDELDEDEASQQRPPLLPPPPGDGKRNTCRIGVLV